MLLLLTFLCYISVHGVPAEAERNQNTSKTLKDSLICILELLFLCYVSLIDIDSLFVNQGSFLSKVFFSCYNYVP